MSLTERLIEPTQSNRRKICGIKRLYNHLTVINQPAEIHALSTLLNDDDRSNPSLYKILKEEGFSEYVTVAIIERHRAGVCACR